VKGNKSSRMSCTRVRNGRSSSTHGKNKNCVVFVVENTRAKSLREKLGVCGRKTLNATPEKSGLRAETGPDRFRIGYNSGYL
jgi:hypothetical protein